MMKKIGFFMILLAASALCGTVSAAVLTVGHSHEYAYRTITEALDAATMGDEIRVSAGEFNSTHPQYPETFPLVLKPGVSLRRMSDDIKPVISADNGNKVFSGMDIPWEHRITIEGFRIMNGRLTGASSGAGIMLDNACVTIQSCDFEFNQSDAYGGAMIIHHCPGVSIIDCVIADNSADMGGGGISVQNSTLMLYGTVIMNNSSLQDGGGIHSYQSDIQIQRCDISGNSANGIGGGIGVHGTQTGTIEIDESEISNNSSNDSGGGIGVYPGSPELLEITWSRLTNNTAPGNGGGLYIAEAPVRLGGVVFDGNQAGSFGGGLHANMSYPVEIVLCHFNGNNAISGGGAHVMSSTLHMFSCLLTENQVLEMGGGLYGYLSSFSVTNATFNDNHASDAGGAFAINSTTMKLKNSIVWDNTIDEIYHVVHEPDISYSCIRNGFTGTGNIDTDPLFFSGHGGTHYLSQPGSFGQTVTSPCVDAGMDSSNYTKYIFGDTEIKLSDTSTRCNRLADIGQVDMGYHYYPHPGECETTACRIFMPSTLYFGGDSCWLEVLVCNNLHDPLPNMPFFVILEVIGNFYFAPTFFSDFDHFNITVQPGIQFRQIIPHFFWPMDAGVYSGARFYTAMTNADITELYGDYDMFEFGWR